MGTLMGVYAITTMRVLINPDDPESISEVLPYLLATPGAAGLAAPNDEDEDEDEEDGRPENGILLVVGATPPPLATSPTLSCTPPPLFSARSSHDLLIGGAERSGSSLAGLKAAAASSGTPSRSPALEPSSPADGLGAGVRGQTASPTPNVAAAARPSASWLRSSRAANGARVSFAAAPLEQATGVRISGFDARSPTDRTSRAANVVNLLSAIGGGRQAVFLYDPEDRHTTDAAAAAQRAANRASAASAARGQARTSASQRGSSTTTRSVTAANRSRAISSPQQYTGVDVVGSSAARHSAGEAEALPRIGEV